MDFYEKYAILISRNNFNDLIYNTIISYRKPHPLVRITVYLDSWTFGICLMRRSTCKPRELHRIRSKYNGVLYSYTWTSLDDSLPIRSRLKDYKKIIHNLPYNPVNGIHYFITQDGTNVNINDLLNSSESNIVFGYFLLEDYSLLKDLCCHRELIITVIDSIIAIVIGQRRIPIGVKLGFPDPSIITFLIRESLEKGWRIYSLSFPNGYTIPSVIDHIFFSI